MEVLHITWCGRVGGKERALYQLVRSQLQWSRFRPGVAFGQADGPYADAIRELGCPVLDLGMRNGHDLRSLRRIRTALLAFPLHHFHSAELPLMAASAGCSRVRRVYTHRTGQHAYPLLKRLQYRCVSVLIRRRFDAVSANTRHAARAAAPLLRIPEASWHVTYNGMDFDLLGSRRARDDVAASLGLPLTAGVVIGTSAHLRPLKRTDLLLAAFRDLSDLHARLLVVGDGPDRARLEAEAGRLGIADRTVFAGMQQHIGDFLQVMDIFVLPSGREESFGNSVVEAMAVGLPSIVFRDGGGLPEHVTDGETGFVVTSVQELTSRLLMLSRDLDLRRRIGSSARTSTRDRYSLRKMVVGYDRLYDNAAGAAVGK